jgi:hypothetical protein
MLARIDTALGTVLSERALKICYPIFQEECLLLWHSLTRIEDSVMRHSNHGSGLT